LAEFRELGHIYVQPLLTEDRGWGLQAIVDCDMDDILGEYTGDVITREEMYRRQKEDYSGRRVRLLYCLVSWILLTDL
jgi:hypothetical protein